MPDQDESNSDVCKEHSSIPLTQTNNDNWMQKKKNIYIYIDL